MTFQGRGERSEGKKKEREHGYFVKLHILSSCFDPLYPKIMRSRFLTLGQRIAKCPAVTLWKTNMFFFLLTSPCNAFYNQTIISNPYNNLHDIWGCHNY